MTRLAGLFVAGILAATAATAQMHQHGGMKAAAGDTPSTMGLKAAHAAMMRKMAVPYTGDPDVDFRLQMIPHHEGAIDMAEVALKHAKDPGTRQLAETIIAAQKREVADMKAWLSEHGK